MGANRGVEMISPKEKYVIDVFTDEAPVKLGELARALGLEVKLSSLPNGVSGQIKPGRDSPEKLVIKINRHEARHRQRFTLAHEISHFLLHKDFIGDGIEDNVLYRSKLSNELEDQAHRLAAELIVPDRTLNRLIDENSHKPIDGLLEFLSKSFQVHEEMIKIKLAI